MIKSGKSESFKSDLRVGGLIFVALEKRGLTYYYDHRLIEEGYLTFHSRGPLPPFEESESI